VLKILFNFVLFIFSFVISLLLIEFLLPIFNLFQVEYHYFQYHVPIVQYIYGKYHKILGNILTPNLTDVRLNYNGEFCYTVSTNSEGFRGDEWDLSSSRKNIVFLGDSFAMGWGVQWGDTFSTVIGNRLDLEDPEYQIINLGQSGFSIDQVVKSYEVYGEKFSPELVVYLFCFNDVDGDIPEESNGKFDIIHFQHWTDESDFARVAQENNVNRFSLKRTLFGARVVGFYRYVVVPIFSPQSKRWSPVLSYRELLPPQPPAQSLQLDTVKKRYLWYCLEQLWAVVSPRSLILMDTSHKLAIHQADSIDSNRWILRDFARHHPGVNFCDFESHLRNINDGVARFFPLDDHWNVEGHISAADLLFKDIKTILNL